ncbi:MAG: PKD domain-containing protein, partial [Candidatus Diapherotrites archaeon]|nr:PKD domain-containing protein [Candidatus Diapherotrites archaeon]
GNAFADCRQCCDTCRQMGCDLEPCIPPCRCENAPICDCDDRNPISCICERGGCVCPGPPTTPTPIDPGCGGYFCVGNELWLETQNCSSYLVENCQSSSCSSWTCSISGNSKIRQQTIGQCNSWLARCSYSTTTCGSYPCPYGCTITQNIGNCNSNAIITTYGITGSEIPVGTNVTFSCKQSVEPECGDAASDNPARCTFDSCNACTCSWEIKKVLAGGGEITVNTSNQKEFSHTFNDSGSHKVYLRACDEMSLCTNTNITVNVANAPPVADFVIIPTQGIVGKTSFEMNASASYDPDGTIVEYIWDFGDGNIRSGGKATHEKLYYTYYRVQGNDQNFNVTLTVRDNNGNVSQASRSIRVRNNPPKATFSAVPLHGIKPLTVLFKAIAKDDDGHNVNCDWNFDDGTSASGCENIHIYNDPRNYYPRLIVTDGFGGETIYNLDILVYTMKAITDVRVRNTKVRTDTVITVRCTEGLEGQNHQLIIEAPNGATRNYPGGVPCSTNGSVSTIPGNYLTEAGVYKATVIADSADCSGMECSKTTSFNVYEEAQVEASETNIIAIVAIAMIVLILARSCGNSKEFGK